MIDVLLKRQDDGTFDFNIVDGDLEGAEGFDTAIFLSLLTDQRANSDQVSVPENRRGWLGDLNSPIEDRKIGSLLWLLEQKRLTQENLNRAISFARDAEEWFLDDEIVQSLVVTGSIVVGFGIALIITTTSVSGQTSTHYVPLWEVTGAN